MNSNIISSEIFQLCNIHDLEYFPFGKSINSKLQFTLRLTWKLLMCCIVYLYIWNIANYNSEENTSIKFKLPHLILNIIEFSYYHISIRFHYYRSKVRSNFFFWNIHSNCPPQQKTCFLKASINQTLIRCCNSTTSSNEFISK